MKWPYHQVRRIIVSPEDIDWLRQWKWRVNSLGYVYRLGVKEGECLLHRLIMDAVPGEEVHHINHNALDNRRENLKKVSRAEHAWIHSKSRRRNPSLSRES